jgi:Rha family phage regulatory protein
MEGEIRMQTLEKIITSLEVAEMVGRSHNDVLKDIRNIISQLGKGKISQSYFSESTYRNSQNKELPCFLLTKKGCELYSTRMTGAKGTQFAVAYIERFNDMENHIKQQPQIPTSQRELAKLALAVTEETNQRVDEVVERVTELEENTKIDASDYGYIGRRVNQRVKEIARGYNATNKDQLATLYKDINTGVKQITGVSTRSQLRQKDFDKVNEYINNWQPSTATITIIKDMRDSA